VILALRALGETVGAPQDDDHAQTCPHCRHELVRLTEVVELARQAGPGEPLEPPPPAVWDRIAAAVANDSAANNSAANNSAANNSAANNSPANNSAPTGLAPAPTAPAPAGNGTAVPVAPLADGGTRARRGIRAGSRRGRLATALGGLAAGLIIGIGGTAGIAQLTKAPATRVVAQIELSPLPEFPQWQGAAGTAVMRATASQQVMVVTLRAPQRPGFYEVWLLARNGVSMISLGDLNADHTGTFTVPPGVDLRNYSRIDISLQPFNGSTLHSKTSVVRGSLPAAALGAASVS